MIYGTKDKNERTVEWKGNIYVLVFFNLNLIGLFFRF